MLATERGALSLGGAAAGSGRGDLDGLGLISAAGSKLGSLDGEIDVLLAGGALEIQAGEQLRRLRVVDVTADAAGAAAGIELHMPTKLAAEVSLLAAAIEIDPKPQHVDRQRPLGSAAAHSALALPCLLGLTRLAPGGAPRSGGAAVPRTVHGKPRLRHGQT